MQLYGSFWDSLYYDHYTDEEIKVWNYLGWRECGLNFQTSIFWLDGSVFKSTYEEKFNSTIRMIDFTPWFSYLHYFTFSNSS